MRILIIRHGESEADLLGVHEEEGADFSLTERGHRQAEAMAAHIAANYKLSKIYCSTLSRARQTAQHLSDKTAVPLTSDERLMEFNNGLLAGLKPEVADEKYPSLPDLPLHEAAYEQESTLSFRFRADFMLSKILSENEDDATVAVVTHGGTIKQLYRAFLRLPVDSTIAFYTGDTGIHEWLINAHSRSIVKANDTAHTKGI